LYGTALQEGSQRLPKAYKGLRYDALMLHENNWTYTMAKEMEYLGKLYSPAN